MLATKPVVTKGAVHSNHTVVQKTHCPRESGLNREQDATQDTMSENTNEEEIINVVDVDTSYESAKEKVSVWGDNS